MVTAVAFGAPSSTDNHPRGGKWPTLRILEFGLIPLFTLALAPAVGGRIADMSPMRGNTLVANNMNKAAVALAPDDASLPGPYAVGATRRRFIRESTTTGEQRELNTAIWYPAIASADGFDPPPGRPVGVFLW